MPKMTGIQLCEHIREMPDHAHTPFILLTAKCMEIDVAKLRQRLGMSAALPKPFSPSELLTCIEESLVQQRRLIASVTLQRSRQPGSDPRNGIRMSDSPFSTSLAAPRHGLLSALRTDGSRLA